MFGFRTTITCAVMAFIAALATLLILIQSRTFNLTTVQAAAAYMDAASEKSFGRLQSEVSEIATLVRVLAASSSLADSAELPKSIAQSPSSKSRYMNCHNWTVSTLVTTMAVGYRCETCAN